MKNNILTIATFLMLLFGYMAFSFGKMYFYEHKEKNRITGSWKAANQQIIYFKAKNGNLGAKNDALRLKYKELKEIYPKIIAEIKT